MRHNQSIQPAGTLLTRWDCLIISDLKDQGGGDDLRVCLLGGLVLIRGIVQQGLQVRGHISSRNGRLSCMMGIYMSEAILDIGEMILLSG